MFAHLSPDLQAEHERFMRGDFSGLPVIPSFAPVRRSSSEANLTFAADDYHRSLLADHSGLPLLDNATSVPDDGAVCGHGVPDAQSTPDDVAYASFEFSVGSPSSSSSNHDSVENVFREFGFGPEEDRAPTPAAQQEPQSTVRVSPPPPPDYVSSVIDAFAPQNHVLSPDSAFETGASLTANLHAQDPFFASAPLPGTPSSPAGDFPWDESVPFFSDDEAPSSPPEDSSIESAELSVLPSPSTSVPAPEPVPVPVPVPTPLPPASKVRFTVGGASRDESESEVLPKGRQVVRKRPLLEDSPPLREDAGVRKRPSPSASSRPSPPARAEKRPRVSSLPSPSSSSGWVPYVDKEGKVEPWRPGDVMPPDTIPWPIPVEYTYFFRNVHGKMQEDHARLGGQGLSGLSGVNIWRPGEDAPVELTVRQQMVRTCLMLFYEYEDDIRRITAIEGRHSKPAYLKPDGLPNGILIFPLNFIAALWMRRWVGYQIGHFYRFLVAEQALPLLFQRGHFLGNLMEGERDEVGGHELNLDLSCIADEPDACAYWAAQQTRYNEYVLKARALGHPDFQKRPSLVGKHKLSTRQNKK